MIDLNPKDVYDEIFRLAEDKQLGKVKNTASWWTTCIIQEEILKFIRKLANQDSYTHMTLCQISRGSTCFTFVFDGVPADVLSQLQSIKPRSRGKTAPKVLVKMIYTRILKLEMMLQDRRARVARHRATGYPHLIPQGYTVPTLTRQNILEREDTSQHWHLSVQSDKVRDKLLKVLNREDVTKEMIDQAWALFETQQIMAT